ncbi:MAG: hypothetical protein HOP07_11485 [Bacteriovoracaceae bacterium]|nr:hypothetical protein [Bacteriovoracaceae bacterium]
MRTFIQTILFAGTILISSCSTYVEQPPQRQPAQASNAYLDTIMSVRAVETKNLGKESENKKEAKEILDSFTSEAHASQVAKRYEFVETKSLPDGILFKLELDVDPKNSNLIYRIYHAPGAFKDRTASAAITDFTLTLINSNVFGTPFSAFETYYNARHGDPIATNNLLSIRMTGPTYTYTEKLALLEGPDFKKSLDSLQQIKVKLASEIKQLKTKRKAEDAKRKIGLDTLDKAPVGKQFRDLIAKGDRKGTADLLQKYLPWEDMAPFETKFWRNYISIITKPVPLEQRVLIYRGLNDDYINRAYVNGKILTEKEAIEQDKAFVMSSGMVKNQGSWNRRLRTLEAMNGKVIGTINGETEFSETARISTMFLNHSANPMGSPYISFSPNLNIANGFGSDKVSSYLIDPRLLNFNYASTFVEEVEYLLPISTFPDELVAILDREVHPMLEYDQRQAWLDKKLEKLIAKEYGEAKKAAVLLKIRKNTYQFFKGDYPGIKDTPGKSPGTSNLDFYKKFLEADDPKPTLAPNGEMTCKDLIELFWVVK